MQAYDSADAGKTAYYAPRWVNRAGEHGPWNVTVRTSDLNARGFNGVTAQTVSVSGANGGANFIASLFKITGQVQAQGFNLSVAVEPSRAYRIQASTNLTLWSDVTSFSTGSSPFQFLDTGAIGLPRRFYRVVSP